MLNYRNTPLHQISSPERILGTAKVLGLSTITAGKAASPPESPATLSSLNLLQLRTNLSLLNLILSLFKPILSLFKIHHQIVIIPTLTPITPKREKTKSKGDEAIVELVEEVPGVAARAEYLGRGLVLKKFPV
jgi:hypothetical protein